MPWPCTASQVSLQGIPDIRKVFIREAKRVVPSARCARWVLQ